MRNILLACILAVALLVLAIGGAYAQQSQVRAVLFYSPTCPHCHYVIDNVLLPMADQYGDQLQVLAVSISTPEGGGLYASFVHQHQLPAERQGVPTLVMGEVILVGSVEIEEQFPPLFEAALEQGGVEWPQMQGLAEMMPQATPTQPPVAPSPTAEVALVLATEEASIEPAATPALMSGEAELPSRLSALERFMLDPLANAIAVLVLIGMLASVPAALLRSPTHPARTGRTWLIPFLVMLGLGISSYLSFVETTGTEAVCGPVGDCNTVQKSQYAILFGILPVGVLGVLGYLAILAAWLAAYMNDGPIGNLSRVSLLGMSVFGVLFSIYLTFLEPFVIGATCAWCLGSAAIMTALLWLTAPAGLHSLRGFTQ